MDVIKGWEMPTVHWVTQPMGRSTVWTICDSHSANLDDPMVLKYLKSLLTRDSSRESEDRICHIFLQVEYDTGQVYLCPVARSSQYPFRFFDALAYDPRKTGKFDMGTKKLWHLYCLLGGPSTWAVAFIMTLSTVQSLVTLILATAPVIPMAVKTL